MTDYMRHLDLALSRTLVRRLSPLNIYNYNNDMSGFAKNPVYGVSGKVRHESGCMATENDQRLDISDLGKLRDSTM